MFNTDFFTFRKIIKYKSSFYKGMKNPLQIRICVWSKCMSDAGRWAMSDTRAVLDNKNAGNIYPWKLLSVHLQLFVFHRLRNINVCLCIVCVQLLLKCICCKMLVLMSVELTNLGQWHIFSFWSKLTLKFVLIWSSGPDSQSWVNLYYLFAWCNVLAVSLSIVLNVSLFLSCIVFLFFNFFHCI